MACGAQDKSKRPSPPATASVDLGGTKITIDYSSPRLKGRHVGGEVATFGKVWRLGANESTTFVTTGNVTVGGKTVPAGSYTMFAIPDKDKWTLIISKKTGEWGTTILAQAKICAHRLEGIHDSFIRKLHNFVRQDRHGRQSEFRLGHHARLCSHQQVAASRGGRGPGSRLPG